MKTLLLNLTVRFDRECSHILLALGYGLWLLGPASAFGSTPLYAGMSRLARGVAPGMDGENLWGGIMLVAGSMALVGMVTGSTSLRRSSALLLAVLWGLMAGSFYVSNPRSPACWTWSVLAYAALTRGLQIAPTTPENSGQPTAT